MHSHNDELNRLLDSLALGTSDGSFDLDRDTVEISSHFLRANQPMPAPTDFASRLEDSLMKRATMTPVAISGRIEHIGEGIGLIAAKPLPRRIRIERIAVLAAVVLLMLAAGGFYRSDSDKGGGNWLLAPVASASPAVSVAQNCPMPSDEAVAEVESANYQYMLDYGVRRDMPNEPGRFISVLPESMLPVGPSADTATTAVIEKLAIANIGCWQALAEIGAKFTDTRLSSTTVFDDGRIGALLDMKLNGTPIEGYTIFAPVTSGWVWFQSVFALPDDELAAMSSLNTQTSWTIQMYETQSTDQQTSAFAIWEIHVPADEPVELTLQNIGAVAEEFVVSDSGIDETLAPGEKKTVSATFSPGWHTYSTMGSGDTYGPAVGYIYAEDTSASTPVASASPAANAQNCPSPEEFQATAEANGNPTFFGIQVPAIFPAASPPTGVFANTDVHMQPAPNDPAMLIQTTALSDIPEGSKPDLEVLSELAGQVQIDLYCFVSRDETTLTSPINITRTTTLPEGRVGVLLDSDPLGYGAQFYMIYVQGTQQWLLDFMSFAIPDSDFVAPSDLELETIILLQGWNSDENEVHSSNGWPSPVGVPANTDVSFDVKNLGSEPLTFAISGTDVNMVLAVDEQRDIVVNLEPGVYRYSFSRPTDTTAMEPGFIFAESSMAEVPLASECQRVDIGNEGVEALMAEASITGRSSIMRSAPGNPSIVFPVRALEDLPNGPSPDADTTRNIETAVRNVTACQNAGMSMITPSINEYLAAKLTEQSGDPTSTPIASGTPYPLSNQQQVPTIIRIDQIDAETAGVLLVGPDDLEGFQTYVRFVLRDGKWIPLNSMTIATEDWISESIASDPVATFGGFLWENEYPYGDGQPGYLPPEVKIYADTSTQITLRNRATGPKTFVIEGTDISVTLQASEEQTITVTLPIGSYRMAVYENGDGEPSFRGFLSVVEPETSAATPTAATPAASGSVYCLPQDAWFATATANGIRTDYAQAITNPTQITAPNDPDEKIWAVAESQLPPFVRVEPDLSEAFTPALRRDFDCAIEARGGPQSYNPQVISITQLQDGRIGVLIDEDLAGLGVEQYLIYAPGVPDWLLYEIAYVVPDEELLANVAGPIQTSINIDLWTTQATDSQSQSCSPAKVRVASGQSIDLTIRNLSLLPLTLSIPGVSVEESIGAGETSTISATFEPGVYLFSSSNAADTAAGPTCVIYATELSESAATPTT